jgi:hypothetical protein
MRDIIIRFMCALGMHDWEYGIWKESEKSWVVGRRCYTCPKKQVFLNTWTTVETVGKCEFIRSPDQFQT